MADDTLNWCENTPFTIVCDNQTLTVRTDILNKIPYFHTLLNSNFRERHLKTVNLTDVSSGVCQNILAFVKTGELKIPKVAIEREECLGLAKYWGVDGYIGAYFERYTSKRQEDKGELIEIINYLALTKMMRDHTGWLSQSLKSVMDNKYRYIIIHPLLPETINEIVDLFQDDAFSGKYMFPLVRDWYLSDRDQNKVVTIVSLCDKINISMTSLLPRKVTTEFIDVFPDPCFAKKIANWFIRQEKNR